MVLRKFKANVELDDLIQQGCLGALQVAARYDASRGIPFPAFAFQRIRGAMLDSMRRSRFTALSMVPLEEEWEETESGPADEEQNAAIEGVDRLRRLERIAVAVLTLTPRERTIVTLHYDRQLSLRAAGLLMRVCPSRAAQIHLSAIAGIQRALAEPPV